MPVDIRPVQEGDRPDWQRLWSAYLRFYETALDEKIFETTFGRILAGNQGAEWEPRGLLALAGERPVGLVHFLFHRHCWRLEKACYLQDLYVEEGTRGRGAGRSLIEAVYAAADESGNPGVYWLTQDFNATARKLYDRIATVTPFIKYSR